MGTKSYVALLRGINVGGRNLVPMADLRATFETDGFENVQTYIQSGNVLFETDTAPVSLERDLEGLLLERFGLPLIVVARSHALLRFVVTRAPDGFGSDPDVHLYDVVFLKEPLTVDRAMGVIGLREGVDQAWPGSGVVYFARLNERRAQSRMSRITGTPEYQLMTIRNWNTTTKLLALLDARTG